MKLLCERDFRGDFQGKPEELDRLLDGLYGMGFEIPEVLVLYEDYAKQLSSSSPEQRQKESEDATMHEQPLVSFLSPESVIPPVPYKPPHAHVGAATPNASGSTLSPPHDQSESGCSYTRPWVSWARPRSRRQCPSHVSDSQSNICGSGRCSWTCQGGLCWQGARRYFESVFSFLFIRTI